MLVQEYFVTLSFNFLSSILEGIFNVFLLIIQFLFICVGFQLRGIPMFTFV